MSLMRCAAYYTVSDRACADVHQHATETRRDNPSASTSASSTSQKQGQANSNNINNNPAASASGGQAGRGQKGGNSPTKQQSQGQNFNGRRREGRADSFEQPGKEKLPPGMSQVQVNPFSGCLLKRPTGSLLWLWL